MGRNLLLVLAGCAVGLFFEGLAGYLWFCKKPVSFFGRGGGAVMSEDEIVAFVKGGAF